VTVSLIPFGMQCGYCRCSLPSATAWMTYEGQCQSTLIPLITVSTAGAIVLSPTFPGPSPPSRNDTPTSPATVKGLVSERRLESKVEKELSHCQQYLVVPYEVPSFQHVPSFTSSFDRYNMRSLHVNFVFFFYYLPLFFKLI